MDLALLEYIIGEVSEQQKDPFKEVSLAQLERLLVDLRHNFVLAQNANGEVTLDYQQSFGLYNRIVMYCIKNTDSIIEKYDIDPRLTYGKLAEKLVEIQILRKM